MTSAALERIVAVSVHARSTSAGDRDGLAAALESATPSGSVVLATCHRVEAYIGGASPDGIAAISSILPRGASVLGGEEAVRHLVGVAIGLDSVVVGEDEILHQLRDTLDRARRSAGVDPLLDRLFAIALRAGRQARSWQQGPRRSLGDVAIDAIEARRGPVTGRPVIVVGAGRMGAIAARCAVRAGATVLIANRNRSRAATVAASVGGGVTDLDPGAAVDDAVGVVVALGGPWQMSAATGQRLGSGRAVVVDLSFPPALPASVAERLGDRLVTADGLATSSQPDAIGEAHASADRVEALRERAVAEFTSWVGSGDSRSTAEALIRQADAERERELEALWRRVPELDPAARAAIEGMTRHLAARLLQAPLERLGRDPDGREGRAVREIFAL